MSEPIFGVARVLRTNRPVLRVIAVAVLASIAGVLRAADHSSWQELSKLGTAQTRGATAFWAGAPELTPRAKVKVLDVDGPGVITSFHVSAMNSVGEEIGQRGSRVAVLRCRTWDRISFHKSCLWTMQWSDIGSDRGAKNRLGDTPIPYRHAVYYYTK